MKVIHKINHKTVSREEFDAHEIIGGPGIPYITQGYSDSHPGGSLSLSAHPEQCEMLNAELRRHGITGVYYDPKKHIRNCIITSRRDRARAMKILGPMLDIHNLRDADGGYGDG